MASGESFANKKSLPPRDYLYKHCVSKSATYNKKKYEKCHPKVSPPPPLKWPHVKISQKKLTPRDYLYKHCVWKSATYNKKKYEKCHPKVKNAQNWPIFWPVTFDLLTFDLDFWHVTSYTHDTYTVKVSSRYSIGKGMKSCSLTHSLTDSLTKSIVKGERCHPKTVFEWISWIMEYRVFRVFKFWKSINPIENYAPSWSSLY